MTSAVSSLPVQSNSPEPHLPRAAFKLPPRETWSSARSDLPTLPVYANRIPVTATYALPSVVRAHTSPVYNDAPSKKYVVYAPVLQQTRSQDELGGYQFSYSGGPSSRFESRDHNGVVRGSYSYVDPTGELRSYHYVADHEGFRVKQQSAPQKTQPQAYTGLSRRVPKAYAAAGTTAYKTLPYPGQVSKSTNKG